MVKSIMINDGKYTRIITYLGDHRFKIDWGDNSAVYRRTEMAGELMKILNDEEWYEDKG